MSADHAAAPSPEAARTVGDYQLMRRLGSGSMGEVWLGRHLATSTLAAVKLLRQGVRSRDRIAKTFDRERRAIGRLGHPHIVALFDVGPDWLATAYVDGTDLARRLKTPIDPAAAVHLTLQVASALAHAHAYGVVHRDVKPSNILIDTAGNAFLADFGLALLPEAIDDDHRVGTPAFMAPEQARGELAGPAADQYSLARTLLEMLVGGTLPLDPKEALAELPAELPPALAAAVARATSVAAADRFAEISDFAAALAAVDLARYPPPRRLAPEVRVRTPFGWTAGAARVEMLAPDLQRVDYGLGALADRGFLAPAALERFTARTGYADVGFSLFGNSGRLGRLTDPSAFARATIADHDPVAPARILERALDALGFPRTHVRRLVATGGRFPHAEQADHPEWTLRNIADLTACVGAMLRASSEGTPMPTEVASTLIGSSDV